MNLWVGKTYFWSKLLFPGFMQEPTKANQRFCVWYTYSHLHCMRPWPASEISSAISYWCHYGWLMLTVLRIHLKFLSVCFTGLLPTCSWQKYQCLQDCIRKSPQCKIALWLVTTIMSNSNFFLNMLPCYLLLCLYSDLRENLIDHIGDQQFSSLNFPNLQFLYVYTKQMLVCC